MSRPRTPTAVLNTKGTFLKHPERKRTGEPTTDRPLGGPPKHLDDEQRKTWQEIKRQLLPGVAKHSDRVMFEALVRLVTKMRLGTLSAQGLNQMIQLSSRFAMTPSDRSKVIVDSKPESKLQNFLKRKQQPQSQPQRTAPTQPSMPIQ
jgi:phage terminase small subunit